MMGPLVQNAVFHICQSVFMFSMHLASWLMLLALAGQFFFCKHALFEGRMGARRAP